MKPFQINTQSFRIDEAGNSNVHLFTSITGETNPSYSSSSTLYGNKIKLKYDEKNHNNYTVNLDWFQFICVSRIKVLTFELYSGDTLHIERSSTHNNPNFRNNYKVYHQGREVCDFFTIPLNSKHGQDEVSCRVNNAILYVQDWTVLMEFVLQELCLEIRRVSKIAIALDGFKNLKIMDLCRRYMRTKTIQINNNKIDVNAMKFNKPELSWAGYVIGSKKYQKFVRVYDKVAEIRKSGKDYITKFWLKNNMETNAVGRFELEIGYRHLKKYPLTSIHQFSDTGFLSGILHDEVTNWLTFYQVKLHDIKQYRKDVAIKKGKEKPFIFWDRLPVSCLSLETIEYFPNELLNAKKSITFALREIMKDPKVQTTYQTITYIYNIASQYNLHRFTSNKINFLYKDQQLTDQTHPIVQLRSCLILDYPFEINKNFDNPKD